MRDPGLAVRVLVALLFVVVGLGLLGVGISVTERHALGLLALGWAITLLL